MDLITNLKNKLSPSKDYIFDTIKIKNKRINLVYNEVLTDTKAINEYIYKRLILLKSIIK